MRKIIVLTFMSLDGVMQAPGGPEEDLENNFKFGGWQAPYFDNIGAEVINKQMSEPFDLLLGRKTYDIFAGYWPLHEDMPVVGPTFKTAVKYVVSHGSPDLTWDKSELISSDVVAKLKELKETDGPMLQVYGSSILVKTLLENDLVDELWLKTYPVTLGIGKRLFDPGLKPAAWELYESTVTPSGVVMASYRRAGDVKPGSLV